MAQQITQFRANDGQLFDTEEQADAHDKALALSKKVDAYMKATGVEGAPGDKLRKHLTQFLAMIEDGVVPPAEPKTERKPRTPAADAPKA